MGVVETLSPTDFEEWLAYRQIVPDPMERVIVILKTGLTLLANAWGAKIEPDDLDPMKHEEPKATGAQITATVTAALGPGIKRDGDSDR